MRISNCATEQDERGVGDVGLQEGVWCEEG